MWKFEGWEGSRGKKCINLSYFGVIAQTVAEVWPFVQFFFQNGGRPPSWICYAHVWTTHEGHLVFITV